MLKECIDLLYFFIGEAGPAIGLDQA